MVSKTIFQVTVLCVAFIFFTGTVNGASINGELLTDTQKIELQVRIFRIFLTLKFDIREDQLYTIPVEEQEKAVISAFEKEIEAIKSEISLSGENIDKTGIISLEKEISAQLEIAVSSQLRFQGIFSVENEYLAVLKLAVMMALKFRDRGNKNPPTTEEMFLEAINALDKEIEVLEKAHRLANVDETSNRNSSGALHPRQIVYGARMR